METSQLVFEDGVLGTLFEGLLERVSRTNASRSRQKGADLDDCRQEYHGQNVRGLTSQRIIDSILELPKHSDVSGMPCHLNRPILLTISGESQRGCLERIAQHRREDPHFGCLA